MAQHIFGVCEFLEVAFDERVTSFTQLGRPAVSNSSHAPASGIDPSALTRYRDTVPPEALGYIEAHCAAELFWHGPGGDSC